MGWVCYKHVAPTELLLRSLMTRFAHHQWEILWKLQKPRDRRHHSQSLLLILRVTHRGTFPPTELFLNIPARTAEIAGDIAPPGVLRP